MGTATAASGAQSDADYRIHVGDQLNVQTLGEQSLTLPVSVTTDGTIVVPLAGRIRIVGLTTDDAAGAIRSALRKYIKNPTVSVAVAAKGQLEVLVLGNVKSPGKYKLGAGARVADAIASAGGLSPTDGPLPSARITDAQGDVREVDLEDLLRNGDAAANAPLSDGGAVYVPGPTTFQVQVIGAVDHPGTIELNLGDRLTIAIAKAGASAASAADLNHIVVRRPGSGGGTESFRVDLYSVLNGRDAGSDIELRKGDVVYVPQTHRSTAGLDGAFLVLRKLLGFPF